MAGIEPGRSNAATGPRERAAFAPRNRRVRDAVLWAMPLFFVASALVAPRVPISFCLLRALTGVPCPGCGITRSVLALLRGDLQQSLRIHAAGFAVVLFYATALLNCAMHRMGALTTNQHFLLTRASDRIFAISLFTQWLLRLLTTALAR